MFIATRLTVACVALALVPLFLASGRVPGWLDAIMLAWLVLPLLAAAHVSNTGRLEVGEALSAASWIGLALTAFASGACGLGPACVLLFVVPIESIVSAKHRVAFGGMIAAVASLVAFLAVRTMPHSSHVSGRADAILILLATLHAVTLVLHGRAVQQAREAVEWLDTQRYRVLSEALGDLVLRYDQSGLVLAASGASERLFGIPPHDLKGRGFFERVHVADRPTFLQAVNQAANGSDSVTANVRFRLSSLTSEVGDYAEPVFAWVEMRTRQIGEGMISPRGDPGETVVVAVVRDITERVRHEAEIERAKRDAEQANASKDRFIATVSHELRTPLNAIIGFGEMLASPTLSPQLPEKRREYAEIISTSGHHLLAVVNSLLDLSKLDAGKFELCCEPFDIAQLTQACCDMVGLKAEQSGIHLRREIDGDLEALIGDKRACRQIILNLLSNALKFTPATGRVFVSVRADGNAVLISVLDTGIGMVARDLAKLGDPFFQVRNEYDRPYEGTGLGLSVVKGLVGLHGGAITVESAPGEGTRIAVRLPLDGRRAQQTRAAATKIEVITRYPRSNPALPGLETKKVHKIA